MKRIILVSGLVLIALPGMAQIKSSSGQTTALTSKPAPHYPKSPTEASLKTWVHKYPAEVKKYQEALISQISTSTPDSKPYSDAKAEVARISQIVRAEDESNQRAAQSAGGIRRANAPVPGLVQTNR